MSLMALLLESTVKASIVMLAALIAVACLRRRSAALRHWILSAAIAAATVAPLLGLVTPSWRIPLGPLPRPLAVTSATQVAAAPARAARETVAVPSAVRTFLPATGRLVAGTWLAGAGISVLILLVGLGRLAWIASTARRVADGRWADAAQTIARDYRVRRPVVILQSDHPALLVTWGFVQPKVILPRTAEGWSDVRAGYWFNPIMWIACRRLRLESEQATDDVVLRAGIDGSHYAAHLLELARAFTRQRPWLPAPAIARPSSLERRVRAMLNARTNRSPLTRTVRLAIVGALSVVAIAVASAQGAFSSFSGRVFDPLNGFLPGVTMTLTNTQSGAKHEIRSDPTGHFEFVGLPPGAYSLQAILPGFSVLRGTLDLTGRDVQRDVTLKIGELEETISVWANMANAPVRPAGQAATRPRPDKNAMMQACAEKTPQAGSMGGNLKQPMKTVDRKPIYPGQLAAAGTSGKVEFEARISPEGTVSELHTVSTSDPDFEQAASDAIRQWEFTPTLLNCVAIEVPMKIHVSFRAQ